jgi:hypothetical protein
MKTATVISEISPKLSSYLKDADPVSVIKSVTAVFSFFTIHFVAFFFFFAGEIPVFFGCLSVLSI